MILSGLIGELDCREIIGRTDKEIGTIIYDSREINQNSLFVAIKGIQTDGHKYIGELVEKGVEAVVCEKIPVEAKGGSNTTFIIVENSRKALARLSKKWYDDPLRNIIVIGVTGTNGKTTITFLLKAIIESCGKKAGVIGTTGIFIGEEFHPSTHTTPESLELFRYFHRMREAGVQYVFMEVSSHALEQSRVSSIDFKAAIFTNLTHEHLDYHKNMEEYAAAKKVLFNMLDDDAIALVNGDDPYGDYMLDSIEAVNKIRLGRKEHNDIIIKNEKLDLNSTEFDLKFEDEDIIHVCSPLSGRFNIDNLAFAISVSRKIGIADDAIIKSVKECDGAAGRMQKVLLKNGAVGIVDYAHTPDALEKALTACREILEQSNNNGRLICIFGCGGDRDKKKRPVMGDIATKIADYVIITDDNPRTEDPVKIIDDIYCGIKRKLKKSVLMISNRLDAITYAVNLSDKNDIILIAGKGHETYQIYGKEKKYFDDFEHLSKFT
jgi:UDP-N-acetylmuramoyl-L-alanyl-D-glutamate--2,6-diaminopimelate ligase